MRCRLLRNFLGAVLPVDFTDRTPNDPIPLVHRGLVFRLHGGTRQGGGQHCEGSLERWSLSWLRVALISRQLIHQCCNEFNRIPPWDLFVSLPAQAVWE